MSETAIVWLGALTFLALVTIGWGRLYRVASAKNDELEIPWLLLGGPGLLITYGLVLGMTLEVIA